MQPATETTPGPPHHFPPRRHNVLAGLLSYLIPGLGQISQGRISKGVFFMVTLLTMFFAGQALGDWKNVYLPNMENVPDVVISLPGVGINATIPCPKPIRN